MYDFRNTLKDRMSTVETDSPELRRQNE